MDIGVSLWTNFELVKSFSRGDHMVAHIRLLRNHSLNELLGVLLPSVQIISVRELIPGMEEIFIEAVKTYNAQFA
jgi:hypothetical protein